MSCTARFFGLYVVVAHLLLTANTLAVYERDAQVSCFFLAALDVALIGFVFDDNNLRLLSWHHLLTRLQEHLLSIRHDLHLLAVRHHVQSRLHGHLLLAWLLLHHLRVPWRNLVTRHIGHLNLLLSLHDSCFKLLTNNENTRLYS